MCINSKYLKTITDTKMRYKIHYYTWLSFKVCRLSYINKMRLWHISNNEHGAERECRELHGKNINGATVRQ